MTAGKLYKVAEYEKLVQDDVNIIAGKLYKLSQYEKLVQNYVN